MFGFHWLYFIHHLSVQYKSTIETMEQSVKYVQKWQLSHQMDNIGVVLVFLLIFLNKFGGFTAVMIAEFGQLNASRTRETILLSYKFAFASCKKYIVLVYWNILATAIFIGLKVFILIQPNVRLQKENSVTKIFTG